MGKDLMEQVVFKESWERFFAGAGLQSFDDFFEFSGGQRINKNNKRDVQRLVFGDGDSKRIFFMKRFHSPHFKDMAFAFGSLGKVCSQAFVEWENANLLLDNGIETYRPIVYGERKICGIERQSFIITEKLKGQCLTDFVKQNWRTLNQSQKEEILKSLGKAIRKVHDAAIGMMDLYIWHIFITEQKGSWNFAFIDLHRMKRGLSGEKERLANLGRLDHSMLDEYFDEKLRQALYESYADGDGAGGVDDFIAKVKRFSDKVSAKRKPKPY